MCLFDCLKLDRSQPGIAWVIILWGMCLCFLSRHRVNEVAQYFSPKQKKSMKPWEVNKTDHKRFHFFSSVQIDISYKMFDALCHPNIEFSA